MAKGGKREGAGRKTGSQNKNRKPIVDIINRIIPPEERFSLVAELARGVKLQDKDGVVYLTPPDMLALKHLEAYASGLPPQPVKHSGDEDSPIITKVVFEVVKAND